MAISSHTVVTIIERLKQELNLEKDVEVAEFFDVAQNTISAWKKRNSMNYQLLFDKCAPHDINLNWLIYGEEVVHLMGKTPKEKTKIELDDPDELDTRALDYIRMINNLPWPVSTRRKILETYIHIVHRELAEEDDQADAAS